MLVGSKGRRSDDDGDDEDESVAMTTLVGTFAALVVASSLSFSFSALLTFVFLVFEAGSGIWKVNGSDVSFWAALT